MKDALRGMVCTDRGTTPHLLGGTEEYHQILQGHCFCEDGKPVQITGARGCGRYPGPDYVAYVFVFFGSIVVCILCQLTFRHRASCILGHAFHYSPENAFYIFNQQIYFII